MKKRKNIILALALLLSAAVFLLRITVAEPRLLLTADHTIAVPRLPPEHEGLLIAVVADLHYRPGTGHGVLADIGRILRQRQPDIVLLGGDFIDRRTPDSLPMIDNLAQFVTDWHGRYGTYAVSGNHDVHYGKQTWKQITAILERSGVTVLEGRGVRIPVRGKAFQLFGAGDGPDTWFRMGLLPPDFDRKLPVYGLIHNPEYLYSAANSFDLIFSAHTHYGQVRFPVFGEEAFRPFLRRGWFGCGIRTHRGCTQFITSGVGMSKYPVRWHDLPEIAFVTLTRVIP